MHKNRTLNSTNKIASISYTIEKSVVFVKKLVSSSIYSKNTSKLNILITFEIHHNFF